MEPKGTRATMATKGDCLSKYQNVMFMYNFLVSGV